MKQKRQKVAQSSAPLPPQSKQKKKQKKEQKENKKGMTPQSPQKNQNFPSQNKGKKRNGEQMEPNRKKQKINLEDSKGIAPSVNVKMEKFATNKIKILFPRGKQRVGKGGVLQVNTNGKEILHNIIQRADAVINTSKLLLIQTSAQKEGQVISELRKIQIDGKNLGARCKRRKLTRDPIRRVAFLADREIDHEELREYFGAVSMENSNAKKGLHILTFASEAAALEADSKRFPYDEGKKFFLKPRFTQDDQKSKGALTTKQPQTPQNKKQVVKESDSAPGKRKRGSNGVANSSILDEAEDDDDEEDEDEEEEEDDIDDGDDSDDDDE